MLTAPDGRRATIVHGWTKVLSPIPFPLVGCMTWTERQCQAGMFHLRPIVGQIDGQGARSVAAVLGLKPRAVSMVRNERGRLIGHLDPAETERLAAGSEPAVAEARAFGQQVVDRQFALLTGLIEGQDPGDERLDTWIVVTHADRVDAEALMTGLERDQGDPSAADRRELLGEVAAGLKPDALARIGPRLARVMAADKQLQEDDDLMIRLGDTGEPGARVLAPLLEQAQGRGARTYLTQGLCRAGTAGGGAAQLVTDTALADPDSELLQAALVAVLRMGRRDLAQRLAHAPVGQGPNAAGRRYHREWMEKALAQVTPASPPGACRTQRNNYSLPDLAWLGEGALETRR